MSLNDNDDMQCDEEKYTIDQLTDDTIDLLGYYVKAFRTHNKQVISNLGGAHTQSQILKTIAKVVCCHMQNQAAKDISNTNPNGSFDLSLIKYEPSKKEIEKVCSLMEDGKLESSNTDE